MKKTYLIASFLLTSGFAEADSLYEKAVKMYKEASVFNDVEQISANCLIPKMVANNGKCELGFKINGEEKVLLASPEVASVYMFSYSMTRTPRSNLSLRVTKNNEVLSIEFKDQTVAKKLDFTR